jgi:hypothetical protein
VSDWGRTRYGDPCFECGFVWVASIDDAVDVVGSVGDELPAILEGRTGSERHPDLAWSVGAYVCHINDNLRIWAERLVAFALGATEDLASYDNNRLATARAYDRVPLQGSLWTLGHAVEEWKEAVHAAHAARVVLPHPDRGPQTVFDVASSNAHDLYHHRWDIRRSLAAVANNES